MTIEKYAPVDIGSRLWYNTNMVSRKRFILGSAAAVGSYAFGGGGARPNLKVGIVTDSHLQTADSARRDPVVVPARTFLSQLV